MPDQIISNTSCLIALERIQKLHLLDHLYDEILIPEAVQSEFGTIDLKNTEVVEVEHSLMNLLRRDLNLGEGEAEAIALAEDNEEVVLLDDQRARTIAKDMDLSVTGTIGVLMKAEREDLIDSAFEEVKALRVQGFYVSETLMNQLRQE